MLIHPNFDPVAFAIGPIPLPWVGPVTLSVRWYGLMYLVGFISFAWLGRIRARQPWRGMTLRDVDDMLFFGVVAVIVGGRLGYVLLYKPVEYLQHPLEILQLWHGGMASHGGIIGVILAMWLFAYTRGKSFFTVSDFAVPLIPLALAAGRLGNFINGELWGRPADPAVWPWAMVFPQAHDTIPRHPSQLYQLCLEGLLLFVILWVYTRRPRIAGTPSALFLIAYGTLRSIAEFAREPDDFIGLLAWQLSMGQWLSLPMIVIGLVMWVVCLKRAQASPQASGG